MKFVWQKFDGDYCASQYLVKLSQKTFDSALPMLVQMVAGTALWPDPKTINNIQGQQNNYITSPRHGVIYVRNVTQKKGLDLRDSNHCYDGKSYSTPVKADDNSQANTWLKKAILQMWELPTQCTPLFVNFTACHIWDSPDKVDYYLNLKNLILVPNVFAGLTDHHRSIMDILRYKSGLPNPKNNKSQALNTQEKTINQNLTWRNN